MKSRAATPFTGHHLAGIMVSFFAVVVIVNVYMARQASSTFGGVVVDNSYVASQHYNRWLDEAAAEDALGWKARMSRRADGRVTIALSGPKQAPQAVSALARHPLGQQPEQALQFEAEAPGTFVSTHVLPAGRWRLRLRVRSDGKLWRTEGDVR